MNAEREIAKLEGLLERIQRNASSPRSPATAAAPAPMRAAPTSPPPELEVEEEEIDVTEDVDVDIAAPREPLGAAPIGPQRAAAPPATSGADLDIDFEDEEPAPQSAPRERPALAAPSTDGYEEEPPVKTPPPESGRQPAASPIAASAPRDDVDELLDTRPTMEQLGETVELEGADAPDAALELDARESPVASARDDLELTLPGKEFAGAYDASLVPPATARDDLARHDERERARASATAAVAARPAPAAPQTSSGGAASTPEVVRRPPVAATARPVEIVAGRRAPSVQSFVEMLDASLRL